MMRAALRILEVVGSLSIGGAERVALEIAAGLPAPEFRAELLCAGPTVEPAGDFERNIETEARGRGVTVHRVKFSSPFENEGRRRLVRFKAILEALKLGSVRSADAVPAFSAAA